MTGAAQGIGKGIATALSGEGAVVVMVDVQEQKVADAAAEIHKKTGVKTTSRRLDVSNGNDVRAVVAAIEQEFGRIDILVNNAGVQDWKPFLETSEEMWDRHQAVNVRGTFLLAQAVAKIMVRQKGGKIINIASDSGVAPIPDGGAAYRTSKSAVIGLTPVHRQGARPARRLLQRDLSRHDQHAHAGAIPQGDLAEREQRGRVGRAGGSEADRPTRGYRPGCRIPGLASIRFRHRRAHPRHRRGHHQPVTEPQINRT